jgi:hypothetical protein
MKELFEKVYINSKEDLPKKSGVYECYFNDYSMGMATFDISDKYATTGVIWWTNKVKWYLLPVDSVDDRPEIRDLLIGFYGYLRYNDCFIKDAKSIGHQVRMVDNYIASRGLEGKSSPEPKKITDEEKEKILKDFARHFNNESYGSIEGWIIEEFINDELKS